MSARPMRSDSNVFVLDAWPLAGWLRDEVPVADLVDALFESAWSGESRLVLNLINLGEVY